MMDKQPGQEPKAIELLKQQLQLSRKTLDKEVEKRRQAQEDLQIGQEQLKLAFESGDTDRLENLHREAYYNDLTVLNEELQAALEELTVVEEELRQQNQELAAERQRYQDLFDLAPDGYLVTDCYGKILEANQAIAKMFAVNNSRLVKQFFTRFVPLSERHAFRTFLNNAIASGQKQTWELILQSCDGKEFFAEATVVCIKDPDRQISGLRWLIRDISDRKQIEQQLQREREELEWRVEERTAELTQTNQLLQGEIDSRKQAEAELICRKREFSTLVENSPDIIFRLDLNLRHIYISPQVERESGISSQQFFGKTGRELGLPEETCNLFESACSEAIAAERVMRVEYEIADKHFVSRLIPERGADGTIESLMGITEDISDRKCLELSLHRYMTNLEELYNSAPCGYHSLNSDGLFVRINDTELSMLGYSREEIVGKMKFSELLTPESLPIFEENFLRFKQHGWIRDLEFQIVCKNGKILPISLSATAVKDAMGNYLFSRSAVVDISDRKIAEAELRHLNEELELRVQRRTKQLRESEELFRHAFESAVHGMALVGMDGRWLKVNSALSQILGYEEPDWSALTLERVTHPDDLEKTRYNVGKILNDEIPCAQIEKRYRHKLGHYVWVICSASLVRDSQGHPLYFVLQIQDITERRAIELLKSEFISIVSHELRTPLTSIRGSLGLLAAGILDDDPETAKQMLKIAANESERLVRLVNDILDLERLETNQALLDKHGYDVASLMQQAMETMLPLAEAAAIAIVSHPLSLPICVDRDRIVQVLVNLLNNAIKFSPVNGTVKLAAEVQCDRVLFQVRDRGKGIPERKLETIFGRFQQVDSSDARVKGGTGLGLAICRNIVQQHGGNIWAESILGEGSTFYFTLPIE